jgi:hypothetical protein
VHGKHFLLWYEFLTGKEQLVSALRSINRPMSTTDSSLYLFRSERLVLVVAGGGSRNGGFGRGALWTNGAERSHSGVAVTLLPLDEDFSDITSKQLLGDPSDLVLVAALSGLCLCAKELGTFNLRRISW